MYNSNQQYLPCVILVNTSKHMEGSEEQLKDAVKEIINAIDRCEMSFVDICLIAFNDDISIINPFVPVSEMEVPDFFCCGMAKTNEAIRFSLQQIKDRCTLYRQNSVTYHLPWLWLLSDGSSDDKDDGTFGRLLELQRSCEITLYSIAIGNSINESKLKELHKDNIVLKIGQAPLESSFELLTLDSSTIWNGNNSIKRPPIEIPSDIEVKFIDIGEEFDDQDNKEMSFWGKNRENHYTLDNQISYGGDGIIYSIKEMPNYVAKIYKSDRFANSLMRDKARDKILAMLDINLDLASNDHLFVAWPEDILFDSAGVFQGYIMPRIENMKAMVWASRPSDRNVLWPNGYRWRYSIAIAYNLALTIEIMHKAGVVVGDLNANNILVDAQGHIAMIDTDAYSITTKEGGVYKCVVGMADMLPAELQGKNLNEQTSKFNEKTDCFSLAILVFMLLNNNCHPFGCINGIASSASLSTIPQNIVNGYCPFVDQDEDNFPLETLEMNVFPAEIQHLFSRAFGYNSENATSLSVISNRPSANEWRVALGNLYQSDMIVCPRNHLHEYPKSLDRGPGGCPWCAMERRIGIRMR